MRKALLLVSLCFIASPALATGKLKCAVAAEKMKPEAKLLT